MVNNLVIDGPHAGQVLIGATKEVNKVIHHIRTYYEIFEVTYYRSRQGFRFHSWRKIY